MYRYVLPALLAAGLMPGSAAAETNGCTPITSLPATITSQGIYCLTGDLATSLTSGTAIELANNNITLDCNGYKIGGLGGGASTEAYGVRAVERSNITIRNCNVRGFHQGIVIFETHYSTKRGSGHVVEDNRVDGSTARGIYVGGAASVIRRNQVIDTGGNPWSVDPIGIFAFGGTDVHDNTVDGVSEAGPVPTAAYAFWFSASPGTAVTNNRARNLQSTVANRAFMNWGPGDLVFRGNFASSLLATPNDIAFSCPAENGTTLVAGNASVGFEAAYVGCVDGGGNTSVPPAP